MAYAAGVLFLNIALFFLWIVFGSGSGIAFMVTASLTALVVSRVSGHSININIASFFVTGAISHGYLKRTRAVEQACSLKAEKIEGRVNVLTNDIRQREIEIDSLRKKLARYAALKEVAEALGAALSADEISAFVIDSALRIISRSERALLFLVDEDRQSLALNKSWIDERLPKPEDKKGDIFDNWVLKQAKPLMMEDAGVDFRFPKEDLALGQKRFSSLISAPLVIEEKMMGILRLDSVKKGAYNQEDLRLLDVIADLAAVAFQNNRLYRKTEELAIKDGLTDLVVQKYFKERLSEEVARSTRAKSVFSLLMADIDHFKDYNDRLGHISGDIVLRYLSGILKGAVRDGDLVARYGGEEFALILLGRDKSGAVKEADAIRGKIASQPLSLRREEISLTVSIGVASFPQDAVNSEDLIRTADGRLYSAKAEGRNKVCG